MISEKTKLKLLDKPTKDLIEIRTLIDNEINHREDHEINTIEFDSIRNNLMKVYKTPPIYESMMKQGRV